MLRTKLTTREAIQICHHMCKSRQLVEKGDSKGVQRPASIENRNKKWQLFPKRNSKASNRFKTPTFQLARQIKMNCHKKVGLERGPRSDLWCQINIKMTAKTNQKRKIMMKW